MLKFDEITGLYSRRFFLEALEIEHDGFLLYILFTDHSAVRHGMGFEALEQFMREAAGLLKPMLSPEDMAAYFTSEVFAVYLPDRSSTDSQALAEVHPRDHCQIQFKINGKLHNDLLHRGLRCTRQPGKRPSDSRLRRSRLRSSPGRKAAIGLRPTRRPRRRRVGGVAAKAVSEEDEATIRLIREALTGGRFSLSYQPIVSFESAKNARYKVYLRRDAGDRQPMDKLGVVAVRYGLMSTLDKWTVIRGMAGLIEIQKRGEKPPILFIRLSQNSLVDKEFPDWLAKRFKESRLACSLLVFEIKEDDADEYFEEIRLLQSRLRELGCGVALSPFRRQASFRPSAPGIGPGLHELDGILIERLAKAKDDNSRQAMAAMAQQAHDLKTRVVASGVTTAPQMASIWQFGVTLVQGNMVAEASEQLDFDFRQYAG